MNRYEGVKLVFKKFFGRKDFYGEEFSKLILLEDHHLIKNHNKELIFKYTVMPELCNVMGNCHGGAIATMIDVATTLAISGLDKDLRHSVSVDLRTHYMRPIPTNSTIYIHCKVPKHGKTLSFSNADIYNEQYEQLCSSDHIKAMMDKTWH